MKKSTFIIGCLAAITCMQSAAADIPAVPTNLNAKVEGHKVSLTWDCPDAGEILSEENFEAETFPQEGWEMKSTNTSDYRCTWFHYPTEDFTYLDSWEFYINSGEGSAMVFYDMMAPHYDGSPAQQDEWLISPEVENAAYISFCYFIDPMLLEYAAFEDFNDHYYVKVSHDGGTTWENVWDAVTDSEGINGWQSVALSLGEVKASTKVAFVAQSNPDTPEMGLYFLWAIDDVKISASKPAAEVVASPKEAPKFDRPTYRQFTSRTGKKADSAKRSAIKKLPVIGGYNVYRNDVMVAENITSLSYTDYSAKEPGNYTYKVVSVSGDAVSEAAETIVEIKELSFNPPTNVAVNYEYDDIFESWTVMVTWEAPEGDWSPAYYNVYCNGQMIGWELPLGELGQTDVPNGIYEYVVTAVYKYPDGESEAVGDEIALGTRFTIKNLRAEVKDNDVTLSWDAPKASDVEVASYNVYRANEAVAEAVTETTIVDADVESGVYDYNVIAVYADGELSLPVNISVAVGEAVVLPIPYKEGFDGSYKPANWTSEKIYEDVPDAYMWSFSNPHGITIEGEGFDGGFASIDCYESGFYSVAATLTTPRFDVSSIKENDDIRLSFAIDYFTDYMAMAYMMYSVDNGETWEFLVDEFVGYMFDDLQADEFCKPKKFDIQLTDIALGNETIMFQYVYDGIADFHFALDNFEIYDYNVGGINESKVNDMIEVAVRDNMIEVSASEDIIAVDIYSIDGSLVFSADNINAGKFNVPTADVTEGMCIIAVNTVNGKKTEKLILK